MAIVPPPVIEQRLSALIPRVRALRIARGACRLTATALGTVAAILLLDAAFELPAWMRGLYLSFWLVVLGVLAWRWVWVPWCVDISLTEVATELEKRLPGLGERIRTAVSGTKTDSPAAIQAALNEDTARRAKAVNLLAAFPTRQIAILAAVAGLPLLLAAAILPIIPRSGDRLKRVALPWSRTSNPVDFHVSTGELTVKRGSPVTVSGYTKQEAGKPAPTEGLLCCRLGPGAAERREQLTFDGTAFHATLPSVMENFEYCVEIGGTRSGWFRVIAFDPVELIDGTQIEIVPPAYTKQPNRITTTFSDLEAMQFSTVEFRLKFDRPAAFAQLDWRPNGAPTSEIIPLTLASDKLSATASFRLRQNGTLKLLLDTETRGKRPRTETPITVRVTPDAPPWFEQLTGVTARPRTAKVNDRVHIELTARDDTAIPAALFEYIVGPPEGKPVAVPIPLSENASASHVSGTLDFPLVDKVREGETIRFRVRVRDNRSVDDPKLTPQEVIYPRSGWSELKITAAAPPLNQQDVICRRDTLRDGLTTASKDVNDAHEGVTILLRETDGRESLEFDHRARLGNARDKLRATSAQLSDLARDAALVPELRPIADGVREVEASLKQIIELLQSAEVDNSGVRKLALDTANAKLIEAKRKLSELQVRNTTFAQNQLDRMKLTALTTDQTALADNESIRKADLLTKQRELLARLETIIAESEPLRTSVEAAKNAEVLRLALTARRLADALHALDADAKQTSAEARAALVAVIAADQNALAKQTAAIFAKLETPCRLAGVPLPLPKDFLNVAELAAAGKTVEALAELEKHAQTLERIAVEFGKWYSDRAEPKLMVKQLAAWQDDLLLRFRAATKTAGGFAALQAAQKEAFRTEQKAIDDALNAISLPPDASVKDARDDATKHTRMAVTTLANDGAAGTDAAMNYAAKTLFALSERMPTIAERYRTSKLALDSIRQNFNTSSIAVESTLKGHEMKSPEAVAKKLTSYATQQNKLSESAATLDLPGLPDRHARVLTALKAAVNDLQGSSVLDIPTSQAWARRELDRLKFVLEGNSPPDVKAEELSHKLAALADSLDAYGPKLTAKLLEPATEVLQSVSAQFVFITAPEAAVLLNDARTAVQSAEASLRENQPEESRRRVRVAADSLRALSDRLNGLETDLECVQRLARSRRAASEKPKEVIFSDEARRQLAREAEELNATRVGASAQLLKKRALGLYAKLRAKTNPDQFDQLGSDLKSLATTLDELAAKMADIADLATLPPRDPVPARLDAENFLPSQSLADATRELAKQQRALHAQVTNLAANLTDQLRPALWTSSGRNILWQIARADALARDVDELASMLQTALLTLASNDAAVPVMIDAAKAAKKAHQQIEEAARKALEANPVEAERLRASAEAVLRAVHEKLAAVAPAGEAPAVGDSLRDAERAMRKAIRHLAPDGDTGAAQKAMRDAVNALLR